MCGRTYLFRIEQSRLPREQKTEDAPMQSCYGGQVKRFGCLVALQASACLVSLDNHKACGDGFVDRTAGEACEPSQPETFKNGCTNIGRPNGSAACDAATFTIINTPEQCAICGDGFVDPGEACDTNNDASVAGACADGSDGTCAEDCKTIACCGDGMVSGAEECEPGDISLDRQCLPEGRAGTIVCNDACKWSGEACSSCGNSVVDGAEQCEFSGGAGSMLGISLSCADENFDYGASGARQPFASGEVGRCQTNCRYDVGSCSFCGNGKIDTGELIGILSDGTRVFADETCDGWAVDRGAFSGHVCLDPDIQARTGNYAVPNITCNDGCEQEQDTATPDAPCCLAPGAPCPAPDAEYQCCSERALGQQQCGQSCWVINEEGQTQFQQCCS